MQIIYSPFPDSSGLRVKSAAVSCSVPIHRICVNLSIFFSAEQLKCYFLRKKALIVATISILFLCGLSVFLAVSSFQIMPITCRQSFELSNYLLGWRVFDTSGKHVLSLPRFASLSNNFVWTIFSGKFATGYNSKKNTESPKFKMQKNNKRYYFLEILLDTC